ncbi:MAG: hypothetical protein JXN63_07870 [Candidatus Delongbacteria bacterium]|nr:hypothetical protein [Candidatus Delongbacteria bacterium]
MKAFITKIFTLYLLTGLSVILLFSFADGNTDAFYIRFSSPLQKSLIIGSSRAAQGIVPSIINDELEKTVPNPMLFNYSFALGYSSFGPAYYNSIKRKLDTDSKNGIFIIEVNPWTISENFKTVEDTTKFFENNLPTGSLKDVTSRPNFRYFLDFYDQSYIMIIINRIKNIPYLSKNLNTSFLHDDGWFEVSVRMDEKSMKSREKKTIDKYVNVAPVSYKYSNIRYEYFKKTLQYLTIIGSVYLVRLPVKEDIVISENKYMPDFNDKMLSVSEQFGAKFIDLSDSNKNVQFTDGNHLWKESGKKISLDIARDILKDY